MAKASAIIAGVRLSALTDAQQVALLAESAERGNPASHLARLVKAPTRTAAGTAARRQLKSALAWRCVDYLAREYFAEPQFFAGVSFTASGKPLHSSLHFSLAHSADTVLVAINPCCVVGVDVEDAERAGQLPAKRGYCAADEPDLELPPLDIWTRKEAVIKAAGGGLEAMRQVRLEQQGALFREQRWHIYPLQLPWPCSAHLAAAAPLRLQLLQLDPSLLTG